MFTIPPRALARVLAFALAATLISGIAPAQARADVDPTPSPDFTITVAWADVTSTTETDYVLVKDALGYHRFNGATWTAPALSVTCPTGLCPAVSVGRVSDEGVVPVWETAVDTSISLSLYDLKNNAPVADSTVALPLGATQVSANGTTVAYKVGALWFRHIYTEAAAAQIAPDSDPDVDASMVVIAATESNYNFDYSAAPRVVSKRAVVGHSGSAFDVPDLLGADPGNNHLPSVEDSSVGAYGVVGDLLAVELRSTDQDADTVSLIQLDLSEPQPLDVVATGRTFLAFSPDGVLLKDSSGLVFQPVARSSGNAALGTEGNLTPAAGLALDFVTVQATGHPIAKFTDADGVVGLTRFDYDIDTKVVDGESVRTPINLSLTELFRFKVVGAKPTITGVASFGATLTANPQTWAPAAVVPTYQWYADGNKISAATDPAYTLSEADLGKKFTVEVTGALPGYQKDVQTSEPTAAVSDIVPGKIVVAGTGTVGQTLTATLSEWPAGATFGYQWLRGTAAITGATAASYVVTSADAGSQLSVRLTVTIAGHSPLTLTSSSVSIAAAGKQLTRTPKPIVLGAARVGHFLVAYAGSWRPKPVKLAYQWYRNGTAVPGATKVAYRLAKADRGARMTVAVTGTKAGYASVTKLSSATAKVK
jgi:hypothetical protein